MQLFYSLTQCAEVSIHSVKPFQLVAMQIGLGCDKHCYKKIIAINN